MLLKIFRKSKQQSLNLHTISASWIFFSSSHSTTQTVFFLVEKFEKGPFHQFKHHRTFIWLSVLVLTSKHQTYQVTCEPLYPDGPTHNTAAHLPGRSELDCPIQGAARTTNHWVSSQIHKRWQRYVTNSDARIFYLSSYELYLGVKTVKLQYDKTYISGQFIQAFLQQSPR